MRIKRSLLEAVTLLSPALLAMSTAVAAPQGGPTDYRLLPARSRLVARLFKGGLGARLAHDHVIEARGASGAIRLDPARPDRTRLRITVDARRLRADPPRLRKLYRLPPLSSDDVATVQKNMRAADQLNVARHKRISFRSRKVRPLGKGRYRLAGTLTLRGVSRPVTLDVRARLVGKLLKGSGQLRFKQSDFGYSPYRAALGLIRVRDEALIDIYIEARRR